MKKNIIYTLFILFFCSQTPLLAQIENLNPLAQSTEWKEDTTLVYKNDSLVRNKEIHIWHYNSFFTSRSKTQVDTMHLRFFDYEPNGNLSSYSSNLGQFASPTFSLRATPADNSVPFWLPTLDNLFYTAESMPVYNVTVPFTLLSYSHGMQKEQQLRFTHTQNVNKDLNVGVYLQYYKTEGEAKFRQQARGSTIAPWVAYNGNRFSTYFRFNYNNLERHENGGAIENEISNEKGLTPKIENAQSNIGYNSLLFVQKWNLLPQAILDSSSLEMPHYPLAIGVRFDYKKSDFLYSDMNVKSQNYLNLFHDLLRMLDTALFKIITPMAFVEGEIRGENQSLQLLVGGGNEYQHNYYRDYDLQFPETNQNYYFAKGIARYASKWFDINHEQRYCGNGDYTNSNSISMKIPLWSDYNLNLQANYDYSFTEPHAFYSRYAANTAQWNNDLASESRHYVGGELFSEFGNITLRADYYAIENYIHITADGTVAQNNGAAHATILEAKKTTNLRWLSMQNGVIYQKSTVAGAETPTWATYNSLAVRFKVYRKLIDCLVGGEALYYPKYFAPQFIPSLGVFAPQNEEKMGDFPLVNAFVSIKYKPLRILLKYNGIYSQLAEKRNFQALHYPQQNGIFVFAASWLFYN